ncbi:MAG: hypothetical protein LQ346_005416 [Caloplaca aetnensis]|nr:MAG: hypothetical protein LQ346_005416 [Caloplaca aetnensis]
MLDSIQPVKDIDSSILRVCRSIYDEALPILYGQNTFEFAKPRKLRDFSHGYLDKRGPKFAFREASAGRFTLIRSVVLRLGYDRKPYAFQRPVGVTPTVPDRKRIWVEPFVSKFSKSGRLNSVIVKGIKNSLNLEQLRQGLMKPGGTFTANN